MPRFGLRGLFAAALTLTVVGVAIAPSATAVVEPIDPATLVADARGAAEAADVAFDERRWDDVLAAASDFDAAYADLVALRDAALAALAAAGADRDAAQAEYDDAEAAVVAAEAAFKAATKAAADAVKASSAARSASTAATRAVPAAERALADAQQAALAATEAVVPAQEEYDAAVLAAADAADNFNASIASVLGAPAWWTSLNDRPTTVAGLFGAYDEAVANVNEQQAAYDIATAEIAEARLAVDTATTFGARAIATARLGLVQAKHIGTTTRYLAAVAVRDALERAVTETDGFARQQALADANARLATAESELARLVGEAEAADAEVAAATDALASAQENKVLAAQELKDAQKLALELSIAAGARAGDVVSAKALSVKKAIALWRAGAEVEAKQADLDALDALIDGLADALQSVADRRADLEDLATVLAQTKVTIPEPDGAVHPGDTVELAFSITNSQLFDLRNATVSATVPNAAPLVTTCDIDPSTSVVAAGATVNCTTTYTVTAQDVLAGEVTITVVLSGDVPLGPGNPRARAVGGTEVSVTSTVTFKVEAMTPVETPVETPVAPPVETPVETPVDTPVDLPDAEGPVDSEPAAKEAAVTTSAELSDTGTDGFGSITDAAVLLVVGLGLMLVARRKFTHNN